MTAPDSSQLDNDAVPWATALGAHGAAEFLGFGEGDAAAGIAVDFGSFEAEYAAIRQRVGVMALPHRGVMELKGDDVRDFMQRLVTQDLVKAGSGASVPTYLLDDAGKIIADAIVHQGDASTWIDTDAVDLPAVHDQLDRRLFAEDVSLDNATGRRCIALLGPSAGRLLSEVAGDEAEHVMRMPNTHHVLRFNGYVVTASRLDLGEIPRVVLWTMAENVVSMHDDFLKAAGWMGASGDPDAEEAERRRGGLRGRPVGWAALNTVRVEQALPRYHVDFGPDSTPAEVGPPIFERYVSMTKGCYLGQEVVARTHNLSHPKRRLVQLVLPDHRLPIAGTQVFEADEQKRSKGPRGGVIGAVTSSATSPLRGQQALALAMMKWGKHRDGTTVAVPAEGEMIEAQVKPLRGHPASAGWWAPGA